MDWLFFFFVFAGAASLVVFPTIFVFETPHNQRMAIVAAKFMLGVLVIGLVVALFLS